MRHLAVIHYYDQTVQHVCSKSYILCLYSLSLIFKSKRWTWKPHEDPCMDCWFLLEYIKINLILSRISLTIADLATIMKHSVCFPSNIYWTNKKERARYWRNKRKGLHNWWSFTQWICTGIVDSLHIQQVIGTCHNGKILSMLSLVNVKWARV